MQLKSQGQNKIMAKKDKDEDEKELEPVVEASPVDDRPEELKIKQAKNMTQLAWDTMMGNPPQAE
jgi:hypothetical protein